MKGNGMLSGMTTKSAEPVDKSTGKQMGQTVDKNTTRKEAVTLPPTIGPRVA